MVVFILYTDTEHIFVDSVGFLNNTFCVLTYLPAVRFEPGLAGSGVQTLPLSFYVPKWLLFDANLT